MAHITGKNKQIHSMTNVKIKGHIYSSKAPFLFENLQLVIN